MSAVGFDIGNFTSYVGIARAGGLEILANEYSERHNPSIVAISGRERAVGQSAKQQEINNITNTFRNFKRLIGRTFSDPIVQAEIVHLPFTVIGDKNDNILIKAKYDQETVYFSPQQLYAMLFSKLAAITTVNTGLKALDCVISTPLFSTDWERRAIKEAAQIAGLNCMRLMNDSAAVALNYAMYKPCLPEDNADPVKVAFVDLGYTSMQAYAVSFNKSKLKVLGVSFDPTLGGRDFDQVIADHCLKDIRNKHGLDIKPRSRQMVRLLRHCESAKKMLSTISMSVPVDVECLIDGDDYHGSIDRAQFEKLCEPLLLRVRRVLQELLQNSNLCPGDLNSVEIVGGGTRVPAVKALVLEVFEREPSSTLNADEAVARGCTLMCAILSPSFRVRQVQIADLQPYPITINWHDTADDTSREVFTGQDNFPLTKLIRVNRPSMQMMDIEVRYSYPNNIPFGQPRIGYFTVEGMDENEEMSKLRFRVRINSDGLFEMKQAQIYEQQQVADQQDNVEQNDGEAPQTSTVTPAATEEPGKHTTASANEEQKPEEDVPPGNEPRTIPIEVKTKQPAKPKPPKSKDLNVVPKVKQLTSQELMRLQEQEMEMLIVDRREKEKADTRNAFEEFIYDMRDKLNGAYADFATNEQRKSILQNLEQQHEWLMDTEDVPVEKSDLEKRLKTLKDSTAGLVSRYNEYVSRPMALKQFGVSLHEIVHAYNAWYAGDEAGAKLAHLTKDEMSKVHSIAQQSKQYIDGVNEALQTLQPHLDFKYTVHDIEQKRKEMESTCFPIIRKPAPPPPAAKPAAPKANPSESHPEATPNEQSPVVEEEAVDGVPPDVD